MEGYTMDTLERKTIDLLVNEFWRRGYLTLSRRFGTYLPEPTAIGKFKVDVVGRQKDKYAVGIMLSREELLDDTILEKISFLASRQSKSTRKPVTLLVGVPEEFYKDFKRRVLNKLEEEIRKNIKPVRISENKSSSSQQNKKQKRVLLS
jgi:hypothetical protein